MNKIKQTWPPPFSFRRSKKAKHINLRVTRDGKVEIVLPAAGTEKAGLAALERHRDWVLRQLQKFSREADQHLHPLTGESPSEDNHIFSAVKSSTVPGQTFLHAGEAVLNIHWTGSSCGESSFKGGMTALESQAPVASNNDLRSFSGTSPVSLATELAKLPCSKVNLASELVSLLRYPAKTVYAQTLRLPNGGEAYKKQKLQLWLKEYARQYLGIRLDLFSQIHGLDYKKLRIGWQKGRWGSYSSTGQVSLNAKLIFLPRIMTDTVILHELCHSVEMNHSDKFWKLMEDKDSLAREVDSRLRLATSWVPVWAG